MTIIFKGAPRSKKNSKRIVTNRFSSKPLLLPSTAYIGWHENAMADLFEWKYKNHWTKPIQKEVRVNWTFFLKGKYKQDTSNAMQGIEDVLQEAGIIEDDFLFAENHTKRIRECEDWKTIVEIEEL
jgi:Holliday junction resolvase RusA-like endonuclease